MFVKISRRGAKGSLRITINDKRLTINYQFSTRMQSGRGSLASLADR